MMDKNIYEKKNGELFNYPIDTNVILYSILESFTWQEISSLSKINKSWRLFIYSDFVWKKLFEKQNFGKYEPEKDTWRKLFHDFYFKRSWDHSVPEKNSILRTFYSEQEFSTGIHHWAIKMNHKDAATGVLKNGKFFGFDSNIYLIFNVKRFS